MVNIYLLEDFMKQYNKLSVHFWYIMLLADLEYQIIGFYTATRRSMPFWTGEYLASQLHELPDPQANAASRQPAA
ncbi:MAG: hypothetical protein GY759_20550 [Chloroflexi bacterium]|nr:hypothetical protein [Chloroflexota bacterium]